ncbi:FAD-binding oxidoreductase [Rhodospirillum rubrum]|uniref:FAD-binding oxidoreductase n=1 Tax=Rhodospirillum rubrum TaxID=1085 RepID=UPI001905DBC9|nr:FAD-linked oxidase C-terminal domain-containing protein [Rhodospirillum rubrum]MBK1663012.1 FAD-binding oxidoreductase [Rhodospirillum rubrum]MBK1676025.1 FAD-binding oxidoreductase [Rhodospirillum rubrum]
MSLSPAALSDLSALLGERLALSQAVRDHHGHGESWHGVQAPEAVAFVKTAEEAQAVVALCAAHGVPMVPFGAGSSMEGQVQATAGGLCLDMSAMTAILAVRPEDMDCTVQPGVTRQQLNEHLRAQGLFFPIDPGAEATLGGMASTRASGTNAVRYGTMRDVVLALEVVLADGRRLRTGSRARKSAAGYDLTRLMIGAEGTLGLITELTLRLFPIPEKQAAAICSFPSLEQAVACVVATAQCGVGMSRIEFADRLQMRAINAYSHTSFPESPMLFLEFAGSAAAVEAEIATVRALADEHGGGGFAWAESEEDRRALWKARHSAAYAALALRPGCKGLATDVCVPISRLVDCLVETQRDLATSPLPAPIAGHVGDGNFHLMIVFDPADPAEVAEAKRLDDALGRRALAMEGTCTGEHGIGLGKRALLALEAGEGVDVMRQIKAALDPKGLMNPGKIFL